MYGRMSPAQESRECVETLGETGGGCVYWCLKQSTSSIMTPSVTSRKRLKYEIASTEACA
jgi:hypothetical protein